MCISGVWFYPNTHRHLTLQKRESCSVKLSRLRLSEHMGAEVLAGLPLPQQRQLVDNHHLRVYFCALSRSLCKPQAAWWVWLLSKLLGDKKTEDTRVKAREKSQVTWFQWHRVNVYTGRSQVRRELALATCSISSVLQNYNPHFWHPSLKIYINIYFLIIYI